MSDKPTVVYRYTFTGRGGPPDLLPRRDLTERDLPNLTARQMREVESGAFYSPVKSKAAQAAVKDAEPIPTPTAPVADQPTEPPAKGRKE